ncbi:MAG: EamA family transporter, partial [Ahrensia sp.]
CYAVAGLIIRRIELDASSLAVLALTIGSFILVPTAFVFSGAPSFALTNQALAALVWLGVVPTGIAYILRFYLIRSVGYTTFALSINMIPVFGIFLGFLILGEALRPQVLIALVLVIAGLFAARMKPREPKPEAAE